MNIMRGSPRLHRKISISLIVLLSLLFIFYSQSFPSLYPLISNFFGNDDHGKARDLEAQTEFWRLFEKLLISGQPDCKCPERNGTAKAQGFDTSHELLRPELLSLVDEDIETMRKTHSATLKFIKESPPNLVYTPKTRGLVSTAAGKYLPMLVISLRMLRRTGSTLPMEVFFASEEEYESYICEEVLPSLNAKCIVLSHILNTVPNSIPPKGYQLKCFALLFSSYEQLLFLDSDSFPVHDPEILFTSEPFISTGMITWPDFWASSVSNLYYQISSQPVPSSFSQRATTESGEILISKKGHEGTLLLAMYYNYYGPTHYWPLLSQGAPGEGDKETFLAAADAVGESYYATRAQVRGLGHFKDDRKLAGSAMVQFDPVEEFRLAQHDNDTKDAQPPPPHTPRPFFVHANYPRMNPATIFRFPDQTWDQEHNRIRVWTGRKDVLDAFDFDLERAYWIEIKTVVCELEHQFFYWQGFDDLCLNTTIYWNAVYEDSAMNTSLSV